MAQHNDLGHWGEQMAADYLVKKGWYIRHIDWRCGHRDLDIVAINEDSTMLLVVEVKTRSTEQFGEPDIAIDEEKKMNIINAARTYIQSYYLEHVPVRYDTISVVGTPGAPLHIEHKENAFGVMDNYLFYEERRRRMRYKKRFGCW